MSWCVVEGRAVFRHVITDLTMIWSFRAYLQGLKTYQVCWVQLKEEFRVFIHQILSAFIGSVSFGILLESQGSGAQGLTGTVGNMILEK